MQVSFQVTINKFHTETYLNLLFVLKTCKQQSPDLLPFALFLAAREPAFFSPLPVPAFGSSSGGTWSVIRATRRFSPPVSFMSWIKHFLTHMNYN